MESVSFLSDADHLRALEKARSTIIPAVTSNKGLNAPISDDVSNWFRRIWDLVESGVRDAIKESADAARAATAEAVDLLREAERELGQRVIELRNKLSEAIETYIRSVIDTALSRVRGTIVVGNRSLVVKSVTMQQTIMASLSLSAALNQMISLASAGTFSVSAEYGEEQDTNSH
ncbi:hypothetical protein V7799_18035 [Rhizobium laguerreae]